jgi:hypothetical protein
MFTVKSQERDFSLTSCSLKDNGQTLETFFGKSTTFVT